MEKLLELATISPSSMAWSFILDVLHIETFDEIRAWSDYVGLNR